MVLFNYAAQHNPGTDPTLTGKSNMKPWPYNKAMQRIRAKRQIKAWYNRVFTSERIITGFLMVWFWVMVYIYVWELH